MTEPNVPAPDDSFFASPGRVDDWRKALLYDAAAEAGVLSALPGPPEVLAQHLGLDPRAVRMLLGALAVWDVVEVAPDGVYQAGTKMPDVDEEALIRHHGRAIRSWSLTIDDRLRGAPVAPPQPAPGPNNARWFGALAVLARRWAPEVIDACLARIPGARTALDLGGGHGEHALELAGRGLQVTMQDRPEVAELARADGRLAQAGVEVFAGDFFEVLPDRSFDLVLWLNVAHTYDRARNVELYRRVRPLIAPGGALAVLAYIRGRDPRASILAIQMLAGGGGDAHSAGDYAAWLAEAGFSSSEVQDLEGQPQSLVFAVP